MEVVTVFAMYFVLRWVLLFVTLPFGIHTQDEAGEVTLGTTSSAPAKPWLLRKMLVNTVFTTIVFVLLWVAVNKFGFGLDTFNFLGPRSLDG